MSKIKIQSHNQKKALFLALILLIVMVTIFRSAASTMFDAWQQEEYSYGYLVPLIAIVLLLNKMNDVKITPRSSWFGFGLIVTCVIAQFLFQIADVRGLQPQIFLLSFIGLFILFYGLKASRAVAGPLILLMFAAPLPKFFYYTMSFNMQMMSTSLGTALMRLLGISVLQDGNIIDLGNFQMQVVEACNGLRYLFPLMCLGFMLAYMYKTSFFKRALLFTSTLPIAIIMNSVRIALIGLTVNKWGQQMAKGLLHDFEGWIVFMGCALILVVEIQIMKKIGRKDKFDFESIRWPSLKSLPLTTSGNPIRAAAVFLGLSLVFSTFSTLFFPHYVQPVLLQKPLTEFPMQIGEWTGRIGKLDENVLDVLGTEDYLIADYKKASGSAVNLYVLYYPKQDSTSNQAVHSPTVCIPGGGWKIESNISKTIMLHQDIGEAKGSFSLPVNRLVVSKGQTKQVVYFWFVQDSQNIASPYVSRLAVIKNAIFKGKTNGAMVRILTKINIKETEQMADERLAIFVADNYRVLVERLFNK